MSAEKALKEIAQTLCSARRPEFAPHEWRLTLRDENDDRIRTWENCVFCRAERLGCIAKRLDPTGEATWGAIGVQSYSFREAT